MIKKPLSWAYIQIKTYFKKTHHPYVHSDTINNSKDVETT